MPFDYLAESLILTFWWKKQIAFHEGKSILKQFFLQKKMVCDYSMITDIYRNPNNNILKKVSGFLDNPNIITSMNIHYKGML